MDYVVSGRFSSSADLDEAVEESALWSQGPVLAATYSGYYLLPSVSRLVAPHWTDPDARHVLEELRTILEAGLRAATAREHFVGDVLKRLLGEAHATRVTVRHFGRASERPGDLAITIVSVEHPQSQEMAAHLERIAACIMSSRSVAFHRENAQDLSVRRAYREANELLTVPPRATQDDLAQIATAISASRIERVLARASELLSVSAVVVYESEGDKLTLVSQAGEFAPGFEALIPIDTAATIPVAPELGGSRFDSIGEIINLCWAKNRRLFGSIEGGWQCVGWPFGGARAVAGFGGVVGIVWPDDTTSPLGAHELGQIHSVVRHVERALSDKGRTATVEAIGNELGLISQSGAAPQRSAVMDLPALARRRDVRLIIPTVRDLLRFLIGLTGAISATCRLLTGVRGELFQRSLIRVLCEGDECASFSPDAIPLERHAESVNAWVAVHGQPVYLRSVISQVADGGVLSRDLGRYDGLESISVYRPGMRSELCVPIFAEGRLVGTVNLESDREWAFDLTAEVVRECAQVIGIALLESRRRIGVELMIDAGGFLDKRHELERRVRELGAEIKKTMNGEAVTPILGQVDDLVTHIYMHKDIEFDESMEDFTVRDVLHEAMRSVSWAFASVDLAELSLDPRDAFEELLAAPLRREHANALKFAVEQGLVNTRTRGRGAALLVPWRYPVRLSLRSRPIGGVQNIYVGLSSLASASSVAKLDTDRVFREPIDHPDDDRTRVGAYIAGEILRRCGGSAYFRAEPNTRSTYVVSAEYGVPIRSTE